MIVRIFRSGTSGGRSPVAYIMGDVDHAGDARSVKPEILSGDPNTTIAVIDSIQRKHKYVSGAIAFRQEENPSRDTMMEVVDRFKKTFCAGLSDDHFNSLFVLHRDKGNAEIHFVIPSKELTTGRRMNIHPPGPRNLAFFESFVSVVNHDLGYAQVVPDPLKLAFSDFDRKTPAGKKSRRDKSLAHDHVVSAVRSGKVKNRDDLCRYLDEELGIEVTRKGENYLSVLLPGTKKAKRLKGDLYSSDADYATLLDQSRQARTPRRLTPQEYSESRDRLNAFINERAAFNTKAYLTPKPMRRRRGSTTRFRTTTPKEKTMAIKIPTLKAARPIIDSIRAGVEKHHDSTASPPIPIVKQPGAQASVERENESASSDLGMAGINADSAIASAMQNVSVAEMAVAKALGDLKNARTPQQRTRAEQAVFAAKQKAQIAHAKLAMAKMRANSLGTKSPTQRRKPK